MTRLFSLASTALLLLLSACAGAKPVAQTPPARAVDDAPRWLEACTAKGDPSSWFISCDRLFANFGKLTEISAEAQVDAWVAGARGGFPGTITTQAGRATYLGKERDGLKVIFLGPDEQPLFSGHIAAWDDTDGSVRQIACLSHTDLSAERCAYLRDWFSDHQALPPGMSQGMAGARHFDVPAWMASMGAPLPEACRVMQQGDDPVQVTCPGGMLVLAVIDADGGIANPEEMVTGLTASLVGEYRRGGNEVHESQHRCSRPQGELSCNLLEMTVQGERIDSLIGLLGEAPAVFVQCIQSMADGAPEIPCPLKRRASEEE